MTEDSENATGSLEDEIFGAAAERDERGPRVTWTPPFEMPPVPDLISGTAGFLTFVVVDLVMMWGVLSGDGQRSRLPQAVILLVLAFGLGLLLVRQVGGWWRPFGIGLMVAWGFVTLISLGYFTGVNP